MGSNNRRVTSPFNEKVRVRIFGSSASSSGSEHEGEYDVVSPGLSYLVQNFLEDDSSIPENDPTTRENGHDSDSDGLPRSDPTALINDVIIPTVWDNADHFRNQLLAQVTKAVEIFSFFRKSNKSMFHRNLMAYLREIGYNAGVCKTKWATSGNLKAGNYEFLDVVLPENQIRYIIDTEFSNEFEIARESESYQTLRRSLPRVFVSKPEEMKKIVRLMCDEARRSMKINGLSLPPWRKNRYMQMKWFGGYKRSTNVLPSPPVDMPVVRGFPVKCRAVGFDIGGDCDRFMFPPVTRTQ